jgi:hypothetical protein
MISAESRRAQRLRAESFFKTKEGHEPAGMRPYHAGEEAVREKTKRLRALRLSRNAAMPSLKFRKAIV